MNSQLFFLLNVGIGVGFLVWFLTSRRGSQRPTQLRLRAGERDYGMTRQRAFATIEKNNTAEASRTSMARATAFQFQAVPAQGSRVLNAFFLYNGHDWDAYEVLGLPAGTGISVVTERYQSLITKADRGQLEFYEAAYKAILKK